MEKKCKTCDNIFYKKKTVSIAKWETMKFCSFKCYWQYLKTISPSNKGIPQLSTCGENNPNWKGGVSRFQDKIRGCIRYSEWRLQIFGRDMFTCQNCGIRGVYLEAHHIVALSVLIQKYKIKSLEDALLCEKLWELKNGISLCKICHKETSNYAGKQKRTADV